MPRFEVHQMLILRSISFFSIISSIVDVVEEGGVERERGLSVSWRSERSVSQSKFLQWSERVPFSLSFPPDIVLGLYIIVSVSHWT